MKKIFVLGLGLSLLAAACNQPAQTTNNSNNNPPPAANPSPAPVPSPQPSATVEINLLMTGFTPGSITVKKGTTVVFKNTDVVGHWPASAPHPTHTIYPEFDSKKTIAAGQSWSFTFEKVGTWKYHDHLNPTIYGSVTVTE